jgi:8-oxo-dGTP pyrophosphatase MutT (NUDIX family)
MVDPDFVIPADRLPPGFAQSVEKPADPPAEPKPAATVVLLRDGKQGMEALLLKRHRSSGFVPGAYVFPGGRTDEADAAPELKERATNFQPRGVPHHFWFAAVREVFEETGVLLAREAGDAWVPSASADARMEELRLKLMDGLVPLHDVLRAANCHVDFSAMVYFAHWITPVAEPRRYDTRFFAAALPDDREVKADPREMTDALWLTPKQALVRFKEGTLPMVFPTVRTLEELAKFESVAQALDYLRIRDVPPVLPRLVRTSAGVGIVIDPQ